MCQYGGSGRRDQSGATLLFRLSLSLRCDRLEREFSRFVTQAEGEQRAIKLCSPWRSSAITVVEHAERLIVYSPWVGGMDMHG